LTRTQTWAEAAEGRARERGVVQVGTTCGHGRGRTRRQFPVDSHRTGPSAKMQTTTTESSARSQWLFPLSALSCTPTAQERSLHEEMYDRSRGIEFLYRLGTSIGLFVCLIFSTPPLFNPCLLAAILPASSPPRRGSIVSLCGIPCLIITDKSVSRATYRVSLPPPVTNTSSDYRGSLHISGYKDRRVRKETQGCI
jgi:hypothetical protein